MLERVILLHIFVAQKPFHFTVFATFAHQRVNLFQDDAFFSLRPLREIFFKAQPGRVRFL